MTFSPTAVDCLCVHFADTGRNPKDYDAIFTGDLGRIGKSIVIDQMKENGYDLLHNYTDCGVLMSTTAIQQGESIPSIAHAVSITI